MFNLCLVMMIERIFLIVSILYILFVDCLIPEFGLNNLHSHRNGIWTRYVTSTADISAPEAHGAWLPIGSKSSLDPKFPSQVEVVGEKFVVWKSPRNDVEVWSVMHDVCSHRLAPLSQGRIDKTTNCLECPYHGFQFNGSGSCKLIPQADPFSTIPRAADVASFPVKIIGDMIFAFLPLPKGQASNYSKDPEVILPWLTNVTSYTSRELPYSFDFVIENFMDPAHIPFAHHSLQSVRSDATPIPMKPVTDIDNDEDIVEVTFEDLSRKKKRKGIVSFQPPCYFHFRTERLNGIMVANLLVLVVPVSPGRSRIFVALSPGVKLPLPRWIKDSLTNKFLDTDIWVHDQERVARGLRNSFVPVGNEEGYVLPTESDTGCRLWRRWWNKNMASSSVFGSMKGKLQWIANQDQRDRYDTHIKHCIHCQNALANTSKVRQLALLVSIATVAVAKSMTHRLAAVIIYGVVDFLSGKVVKLITGPNKTERMSAAQFHK